MIFGDEYVKINIIDPGPSKHPNLLAKVSVSLKTNYLGFVTFKWFKIWKSNNFNERLQEAIYIQPPVSLAYGASHPQFRCEEGEDKWHLLEMKIYECFLKFREDNSPKVVQTEEVDEKDIPF